MSDEATRSAAPKIYVDLDDVLCETGRELSRLAQRLHGRLISFDEMTSFDLGVTFGLTPAELRAFLISAHDPDLLSGLQPMDGALETLREWHETGYEIHIVTGRPPSAAEASRQWLLHHGAPHTSLTFVDKYGRAVANQLQVPLSSLAGIPFCFAVEDSPSLVQYLAETLGIFVAMLDRPWNRGVSFEANISPRVKRCRGWNEVMESFRMSLATRPQDYAADLRRTT